MRAGLFEDYAEENRQRLKWDESQAEEYYLLVHSIKSIARGVGAYLLAQLAEAIEYRKEDAFVEKTNPVLLDEYERVRAGLKKLREGVNAI